MIVPSGAEPAIVEHITLNANGRSALGELSKAV
jgi:hypothetical protein